MQYAQALANPFDGPPACVPTQPSLPSERLRVFTKGTFYVGDTGSGKGVGAVSMNPFRMAYNDGTDATNSPVVYTTAVYNGSTVPITLIAGPPAQTVLANSNSPYTKAQFGKTGLLNQYRLVSAGIRVAYVGKLQDQNGTMVMLQSPNHESVGGLTEDGLLAFSDQCEKEFVTSKKWTSILYHPVDPDDLEWTVPTDAPNTGDAFMTCLVSGDVGTAMAFECYALFEIVGPKARHTVPAAADVTGFSAVQALASAFPNLYKSARVDTNAQREPSFVQAAISLLNETASGVGPNILLEAGKRAAMGWALNTARRGIDRVFGARNNPFSY